GQDHVALADVVLDPFAVDGDVAFEEVEARVRHEIGDALGGHVHPEHVPAGIGQHALREVVADEAVDAEDAEFFHGFSPSGTGAWPKCCANLAGASAAPSSSHSTIAMTPPSAHSATSSPSTRRRLGTAGLARRSRSRVRRMRSLRPSTVVNAPG